MADEQRVERMIYIGNDGEGLRVGTEEFISALKAMNVAIEGGAAKFGLIAYVDDNDTLSISIDGSLLDLYTISRHIYGYCVDAAIRAAARRGDIPLPEGAGKDAPGHLN
jgi:hypothetical protein